MKKMNLKSALLLTAVAVMLLVAVGGTVAYLTDRTESVTNTFTPTKVHTEIDEEFDGDTKSEIIITNAADSVKVYIRVALAGNWVNAAGDIVEPWTPRFTLGSDWVAYDGFYYYTLPVEPGKPTSDLLGSDIKASTTDGKTLEVTVIQQAIQAEPDNVVKDTWKVVISQGSVTKYVKQ